MYTRSLSQRQLILPSISVYLKVRKYRSVKEDINLIFQVARGRVQIYTRSVSMTVNTGYTNVIVALDIKNQPANSAVIEAESPFFLACQPFIAQICYHLISVERVNALKHGRKTTSIPAEAHFD